MIEMPILVPKVFVYVTRFDRDLLVMVHPDHPEAGLQVPAGTIERGETPAQAAARELREETGLVHSGAMTPLGEQTYDMHPFGKAELHHRFFFHTTCDDEGRDRWLHIENYGGALPIRLELFWWPMICGNPPLIAAHDSLFDELLRNISGR